MISTLKALALRLGLATVSIAFALCAAEAVLIFTTKNQPTNEHHLLFERDPQLGWRKKSSTTVQVRSYEFDHPVQTNALGLRGPELSRNREKSLYRVLLLGDSFVEGYTVPYEQHLAPLLEVNLNDSLQAEVINGGTAGYSTDQELLFLQQFGEQLEPDLVVLFLYYNDIWYNTQERYWRGTKPRFQERGNSLELIPAPALSRETTASVRSEQEVFRFRNLVRNLRVVQFVTNRIRQDSELYGMAVRLGLLEPPRNSAKNGQIPLASELQVFLTRPPEAIKRAFNLTGSLLKQASLERPSGQFLMVYVPTRMEVKDETLSATLRKYGLPKPEFNPSAVRHWLESFAEESGIPLLDPTEELRNSPQPTYYEHDGHWNGEGNRVLATLLSHWIRQNAHDPDTQPSAPRFPSPQSSDRTIPSERTAISEEP